MTQIVLIAQTQDNGYDCGVYVCKFGECMSKLVGLDFSVDKAFFEDESEREKMIQQWMMGSNSRSKFDFDGDDIDLLRNEIAGFVRAEYESQI